MKILTGSRFQWIAYNTETKQFFGTGGGSYTAKNGVYTENIEFFLSRWTIESVLHYNSNMKYKMENGITAVKVVKEILCTKFGQNVNKYKRINACSIYQIASPIVAHSE